MVDTVLYFEGDRNLPYRILRAAKNRYGSTNEIGVFGFENVPFGNWIIRELMPAPAFVLNETVYPVAISENEEIVEIEIENRFIVGSVQTTKVDAEYPDHKLTGAVFEIYVDVDGDKEYSAEIDKLIGEITEIEDGVYRMDELRYNLCFLHEKSAPEGFLKDDAYHYFEIRTDGETVAVANESGDVATAIEGTWTSAQTQIKNVVNNVVFPVIDMVLAILFFVKLGTAYFDYRKHGQFEFTAPCILFACLIFTLTAPLYIWSIL